jgi:hypothetical protein
VSCENNDRVGRFFFYSLKELYRKISGKGIESKKKKTKKKKDGMTLFYESFIKKKDGNDLNHKKGRVVIFFYFFCCFPFIYKKILSRFFF